MYLTKDNFYFKRLTSTSPLQKKVLWYRNFCLKVDERVKKSYTFIWQSRFKTRPQTLQNIYRYPSRREAQMEQTILLLDDVATLLRVAKSTINRWLSESRKGIRNDLPLPISRKGAKLRWLKSDIEAYLESQSVQHTPRSIPTTRQRQRSTREFQDRQMRADAILQLHSAESKRK